MLDIRKRAAGREMESQKGFTLIELAIVLVIVGLLIGGVIKGQELIAGSRITNYTNEVQGFTAAFNNYVGTYRAMPGDDDGVTGRWATINGETTGIVDGNNDGDIDAAEEPDVWQHLRAANLIDGSPGTTDAPANAWGGDYVIEWTELGLEGPVICSNLIPGDALIRIEARDDDGAGNTGAIRSAAGNGGTAQAAIVDTNDYRVCQSLR